MSFLSPPGSQLVFYALNLATFYNCRLNSLIAWQIAGIIIIILGDHSLSYLVRIKHNQCFNSSNVVLFYWFSLFSQNCLQGLNPWIFYIRLFTFFKLLNFNNRLSRCINIMKDNKKKGKEVIELKSFKKINKNIEQLATMIQKQIKQLTSDTKKASKLKGRAKVQQLEQLKRKKLKSLKNLINSFQIAVATQQAQNQFIDVTQLNNQHQQFEKTLEKLRKDIQFFKTEKLAEGDVYAERKAQATNTKEQYELKIETAQKQSQSAVKNMLKMLYETKEIASTVNVELQRQINQLDNVQNNLRDTQSIMNRAMRQINYFARSVYTDKLLMALMILILLAVVAIVILNIMGKVSTSNKDMLN